METGEVTPAIQPLHSLNLVFRFLPKLPKIPGKGAEAFQLGEQGATTGTAMANFVSKGNETVQLFRTRWLEALSPVHPSIPLVVYLPLISLCAWALRGTDWPVALAGLAGGLLLW